MGTPKKPLNINGILSFSAKKICVRPPTLLCQTSHFIVSDLPLGRENLCQTSHFIHPSFATLQKTECHFFPQAHDPHAGAPNQRKFLILGAWL
jgi:hypothetical protein